MSKITRLLILGGAFTSATLPALAQTGPGNGPAYGYGPMWGHGFGGWGWGWFPGMLFGPLMMLIILIGSIAVIVWLVRGVGHGVCPRRGLGGGRSALDTLAERFAKGEIDKEEFEEKRRLLKS